MSGKFVVRAGQHKFESGEKAVSPVTVLPTAPNDYSRKFFIPTNAESAENNIRVGSPTHILGLRADDHKPIFSENIKSNSSDETVKTNRFYTDQSTKAIVHLFVDLPVMNIYESDDDDAKDEDLNG
jgi:hypothetical protein